MSHPSKTWWGQRFVQAIEKFTDPGRLSRGRAYRLPHRYHKWEISGNRLSAKIEGNINPYFGVYEVPIYKTEIRLAAITQKNWNSILADLSRRPLFISQLMLGEMPNEIETLFAEHNTHLLPASYTDFRVTCSCPDYAVPCKHIAGACYRLAEQLDRDPFLLFELRGMARETLQRKLEKSPLGRALLQARQDDPSLYQPVDSLYPRPQPAALPEVLPDLASYWGPSPARQSQSPEEPDMRSTPSVSAILVKKGGDFPAFWESDKAFVPLLEELYQRMRKALLKQCT